MVQTHHASVAFLNIININMNMNVNVNMKKGKKRTAATASQSKVNCTIINTNIMYSMIMAINNKLYPPSSAWRLVSGPPDTWCTAEPARLLLALAARSSPPADS